MISTNQFRNGAAIRVDGKRFTILYFQHVKPGKGGAFVRTRLRNIDTGAVIEKTFRAGEKLEDRKSTRLNSSHANISYAVFCLQKKKRRTIRRGAVHRM